MIFRRPKDGKVTPAAAKPLAFSTPSVDRTGAGGRGVALDATARGDSGGSSEFWAFLAGPGPLYDFIEVDGDPLATWAGSRIGQVLEVNGETGLGGKTVRVYLAEDGDHTCRFNRIQPPATCTVCVTLVDYDTGGPIAGEPVWLGGVDGVTDAEGEFCVELPYDEGAVVGVGAGLAEASGYLAEHACVSCGGSRTVKMYDRDRWIYVPTCCPFDPCGDAYEGRKPGIFPRKLYGVMSGWEPVTGTGAAQELIYRPGDVYSTSGGPYYVWRSELYQSGAYGCCPGCQGRLHTVDLGILGSATYRGGWCAFRSTAGAPCVPGVTGVPSPFYYPTRIQRDKKTFYASSRMTLVVRASPSAPRPGIPAPPPQCAAWLEIQHYWDAEGKYLAQTFYSNYERIIPDCDTCLEQNPVSPHAKARSYWPICDNRADRCPCGTDPEYDDFYDPGILSTAQAKVSTDLDSYAFCGPIDLALQSSNYVGGCVDSYGNHLYIELLGTVVE